jgi:hypothetical protein
LSLPLSQQSAQVQGEEIAMLEGCSVVELRQYTLHDGARERLIHLFENEFIESQDVAAKLKRRRFCKARLSS